MRVRSICARASAVLSGGSSSDLSPTISTAVPPWPNRITGPKVASAVTPAINSKAPGRTTISCTMKPSRRALGSARATLSSIRLAAASTCARPDRLSATPPTSDLWITSRERIFSATGALMAAAASPAALASGTACVRANGMP